MQYPSDKEVAAATRVELGTWSRYLGSPGESAIGKPEFENTMRREALILDFIMDRFKALGGWSAEISKEVGWQ